MLAGVWLLAAAQNIAGEAQAADESQQVIVVTGERVRRPLKETPSSVRVIGERELDAMSADRVEAVLAGIPNVRVAGGSQAPNIRGQDTTGVLNNLAAFLGGTRPRATLEVDGRALGFQEYVFGASPLWDVKQVEVFRSPLTVTHGRNSIAGGIVVTTNEPAFEWESRGRLIAGSFETREAAALVSGPIVADQLAFRLAGQVRHARTTSKLADVHRGADPNNDDHALVRLRLLAQPRGLPDWKLMATAVHSYSQAPQDVLTLRPFRRREWPFGGYGIFGVKVDAGILQASGKLGNATVDGILTGARTRTRRFAEPGRGESRARLGDLSAQLYGSWKPAEVLTLRGGVHALDSRFRQRIDLTNFTGSIGQFRDHQRSFGAFAEAELALTDRLSVTGGGRYQTDRQRRVGGLTGFVSGTIDLDARFSASLPKVSASYALTPRLKTGLLVQKAYNPGGGTLALDTGALDAFKAEHLWNYEAFLKGDPGSSGVSLGANLFYNDIRNAQRAVAIPIILPDGDRDFLIRYNNVPRAASYGAEVEVGWRATRSLRLGAAVGLLRTRIRSRENSDGEIIGREFERSPRFTAAASADWSPAERVRLSAQLRHHSGYFSDDFNLPELRVRRGTIVDAKASYDLGPFTLFGYVRNLFDRLQVSYRVDPDVANLEDPRSLGIGVEGRF